MTTLLKKALFVIDYQEDFVATDGKLTCGAPAQAIETEIVRLIATKRALGYDIIFTLDTHEPDLWDDHPESLAFPIHCVLGTKGHDLYGKVLDAQRESDIVISKKRYGLSLKDWPGHYDLIEFTGVTTHICVLQNMIMAYNNFPGIKLVLHEDAVASFDDTWHASSIAYMKDILGAKIQ